MWRSAAHATFALVALACAAPVTAQTASDADPQLNWRYEIARIELTQANSDEVELVFTTDIPAGWILYASDFVAELGPRPAKFTFDSNEAIDLLGRVRDISSLRRKDRNFDTEYAYFSQYAEFRQRARIKGKNATISGRIEGQLCYEKEGLCTLYRQPFQLTLP
jgi:thiol:disulfide interchange protein DsbD